MAFELAKLGPVLILACCAAAASPISLTLHTDSNIAAKTNFTLRLKGADARQQLLATATLDSGMPVDMTRRVAYETTPSDVVKVTSAGLVVPLKDGKATILARTINGLSATLPVAVEAFANVPPINFANQIVPIFTKGGCNGGGCHGKSGGQNGFRLSLLGFEPQEDYEHLVKEARGRRLFPASPQHSLLLLKGTATLPHGGGNRLDQDSDDYKLLVRWISQGMPYGKASDPVVERIEVHPKQRTMPLGGEQQLVVYAHYTDGSVQDVTRGALYEPNDADLAAVSADGHIRFFEQPGDVAIMVRYQAKVGVFNATIPLGAPVETLPPPNNFVDEIVFKKLKTVGMPPSAVCDDSTFIRRVTIDIAGRLPTPDETKAFLADASPHKRDHLIERMIGSPDYADHFANKWSALLRNKRADATHRRGTYAFHGWIRDSLMENKPFDRFVREILAASGDLALNPPVAWYRQVKNPTAQLEDTAQLFLGQRLQCAQCHHHPFEKWSQQDYYSFAAFFSQVGRRPGSHPGEEMIFNRRGAAKATNKKTNQPVSPAGLGATPPTLRPDDDPRLALVDWMTSKDNRFFARSLVNRYWKHFFNRGLVDPEDDMRDTNPPTNPELLDALAREFVNSGYDLKHLVRTICRSQVYQLSSLPNEHNKIDRHNFSRYFPRRMTAEVLFDSVNAVTKAESKFDGLPVGTRAIELPDNAFNSSSYFLQVFGRPDSATSCECERSQDASLAQSLHLLNAKDIQEKIANEKGRAAELAGATRPHEENIRELYLMAYSREPSAQETRTAKAHIEKQIKGKTDKDLTSARRQAYEDIIWALINTKEFLFNH
jgi:hypothetical protein